MTILSIGFVSCSNDDSLIDDEQKLKSYELISIKWKLNDTDGQSIVEKNISEFHFINDSDTILSVVIEPLKDLKGMSSFTFNDSLSSTDLNYSEVEVSIPKELNLLSERCTKPGWRSQSTIHKRRIILCFFTITQRFH
ncbi:hypothetical protein LB465_03055 [Salegentibacter sp. LM13S]|uniref:hypothetical protein n=1 Tax=Salegentibacter lacus TaxID=2873599 RepID=UPI001CCDBFA4|nr:hypothetical protein [Salegentibacter lacus]MBZ9629745.1 hypothetical protein [Salegentibacter lacus]